ncbi:DUF2207 domain-containing protein [Kosmotoga sp.]|uniref:DUF2207 domain-containing protein n=1 Tax=Kosmotoga sp. TaxID=1955248 RepID=UPI0024ABB1A7|nr:DUF2207 domain-containing protein [Kosmotoga sp.]MDI3524487.1 hypothetical protein [Kosmotoga sp.]MDK2954074.1 hypothetical protein [Kosmotoga sp.]
MSQSLKRALVGGIIGGIIWVFLFLILTYGSSIGSIYKLEGATIEQKIQEDGSIVVHEKIDYLLVKPYRGVYREIPYDFRTHYSNLKVWADGLPVQHIENNSTENSIDVKVWFVPYQSEPVKPPEGGQRVTLHLSYTVRGAIQVGKDTAQLFRKIWGDGWDVPVKSLIGIFEFPEYFPIMEYYTHPFLRVEKIGTQYIFKAEKLPPRTFAEVRFVFPKENLRGLSLSAITPGDFTYSDIEKIEKEYSAKVKFLKFQFPFLMGIGAFVILSLLFFYFGREPEISYNAEYEREPPFKDNPEEVNAIVKNLCTGADNDGIGAMLLNLYRKGFVTFETDPKNEKIRGIRILKLGGELTDSEKFFLSFLKGYSHDNVFDFDAVKSDLRKSQTKARTFTKQFQAWKKLIKTKVKERRYMVTTGNTYAKLFAVILLGIYLLILVVSVKYPEILFMNSWTKYVYGGFWVLGFSVLFLPIDVFGRWTRQGREYYLKWKKFQRFLEDYSLLSEHPPESITLWEEYLVYAAALGIADKVKKNMERIIPYEVWQERGGRSCMYHPAMFNISRQFGSVASTAQASSSSSSSGGGAGGVGGGSGGGGGGAF